MKLSRKHYAVLDVPDEKDAVVCFSLDSSRPDVYLKSLESDLKKAGFHGELLLDLLAANGNSSRRFLRVQFDGERLHLMQAKIAPVISIAKNVLEFCQLFYKSHPKALDNSVLSASGRHSFRG